MASALKSKVSNRGVPPDGFLDTLLAWAKAAPDALFAPNIVPLDIFTIIKPILGPWSDLLDRKAAMLEAMRVHAGLESSWNWNEGVDKSNRSSLAHISGQETGIFQVSFDSEWLNPALRIYLSNHGIHNPQDFITTMKSDHFLALDYYANLVRLNVEWAGPLIRREINHYLSHAAQQEFRNLLTV